MVQGEPMISISERKNAPATRLFVEQIKHKNSDAPLFILPGGPGANRTHFASYRTLQDCIDLVFFDPRGCGGSDLGKIEDYSLENYIEDIEAIRKTLRCKKISLLGKSYSGFPALGYALRYPMNIDKLILVATGPTHKFIFTAKKKLAEIGTPEQIQWSQKLWEGTFTSNKEVERYFQLMTPLYSTKGLTDDTSTEIVSFSYEPLNRGFTTDLRGVDFTDQLHKIICPTLVVTGDTDWIFDEKYSKQMAETIPNAKLVLLKNAGHFLEVDAPQSFYSSLRDFL